MKKIVTNDEIEKCPTVYLALINTKGGATVFHKYCER